MMHNDRRPHVQKRREELRERETGAVQPGPGGTVGGATSGVGRPAIGAGDQHGSVDKVVQAWQAEDTVRIQPGAITERQIRAWREAADAVPPTRPQRESLGQRNGNVPKLKVKERIARLLGKLAGKAVAKRMEADMGEDTPQKLAASTTAQKGLTQAAISGTTVAAIIGVVRAIKPEWLWPPENDAEAIGSIVGLVTAATFIIGMLKNVWKNKDKALNGVTLTRK